MNEVERDRPELHLDKCAEKAGDVFSLTFVLNARRAATSETSVDASFLFTAAEVRDILRDLARLLRSCGENLAPGGSTEIGVPHDLILRARDCVMNWDDD